MSENIFYTKFSEISGDRFDPQMVLYKTSTNQFKYDTVLFKDLLFTNPMYGANEAGIERTNEDEPRYIRITDIDEFGNLKEGLGVTAQVIEEKYFLNENDLLFARSGATVGKAYIHRKRDYECFFAGYMIRFVVDSNKIDPYYVFLYTQLDIYKQWIQAIQRAAGQPNINAEEYKSLPIPIPPKNIQQEIINKIQKAYKQKEQKEKEAHNKLESIDKYLLQEIGIELSSDEKACLEDRVFVRKFSEISTKRFDASSNSSTFSFSKSRYTLVPFTKYISIDSDIGNIPEDTLATFLPMEKISDKYAEADLSEVKNFDDSKGYTKFKNNDLLWSKITPCMENGKSVVVENLKSGIGFGSTEYFVFRANNDKVNIKFIHALLRLKVFRNEAKKFFSGTAGHQRVSKDFFNNLKIPLPSIEEQNQIVTHIQRLIDDARALKDEAMQIFEDAKKEVEKMILGEKNEI